MEHMNEKISPPFFVRSLPVRHGTATSWDHMKKCATRRIQQCRRTQPVKGKGRGLLCFARGSRATSNEDRTSLADKNKKGKLYVNKKNDKKTTKKNEKQQKTSRARKRTNTEGRKEPASQSSRTTRPPDSPRCSRGHIRSTQTHSFVDYNTDRPPHARTPAPTPAPPPRAPFGPC